MRIVFIMLLTGAAAWGLSSCKSGSGSAFCDTACLKDTMMFRNTSHALEPFVYISTSDCGPDTIARGYIGGGVTRKLKFSSIVSDPAIRLNPSKVLGFAGDTSYCYLLFNDCNTGRGYAVKLPYNGNSLSVRASAINNLDPKFDVADGLTAYSDRGNLFVEDMTNGKTVMMTFGQALDINYDAIHKTIDSVHITRERIWSRVKIEGEWKELQKKIEL